MSDISGKRVVITGGTNGIGLATAQLMLERGARVLITGRDDTLVRSAARTLGASAVAVRSDATLLGDTAALANRVREEFGTVDLLFLNAGITRQSPLDEMTEATFDQVFAVNTKGLYFTVKHIAPLISRDGAVVLATSASAVKGLPGDSVYAASKAAVRSMARTFARDLLPRGIRVNAVCPGTIDSGILERTLPEQQAQATKQWLRERNPMSRFGQPEEVARAVAYLGFEATFTTGAELAVDGGASQL